MKDFKESIKQAVCLCEVCELLFLAVVFALGWICGFVSFAALVG